MIFCLKIASNLSNFFFLVFLGSIVIDWISIGIEGIYLPSFTACSTATYCFHLHFGRNGPEIRKYLNFFFLLFLQQILLISHDEPGEKHIKRLTSKEIENKNHKTSEFFFYFILLHHRNGYIRQYVMNWFFDTVRNQKRIFDRMNRILRKWLTYFEEIGSRRKKERKKNNKINEEEEKND